ncbi:MAG: HNH endonuclease [Acidobacteriota bacterium]
MARDGYRCVACGFNLQCALAAHHRLPLELGGRDTISNLVTLCANCHKAVHWFAVEKREKGTEADKARSLYAAPAFAKLIDLAETIRERRIRTKGAGNSWLEEKDAAGKMPLEEALTRIARRNHLDGAQTTMLRQVTNEVLRHLGSPLPDGCAVRVVQRGRFLSINAGNILLFRTPGRWDGVDGAAKQAENDVLLIWPEHTRLSVLSTREWRRIEEGEGTFAALPCFNLPLDFRRVLEMNASDWRTFKKSCLDALRLGKGRRWVSNVDLPAAPVASGSHPANRSRR